MTARQRRLQLSGDARSGYDGAYGRDGMQSVIIIRLSASRGPILTKPDLNFRPGFFIRGGRFGFIVPALSTESECGFSQGHPNACEAPEADRVFLPRCRYFTMRQELQLAHKIESPRQQHTIAASSSFPVRPAVQDAHRIQALECAAQSTSRTRRKKERPFSGFILHPARLLTLFHRFTGTLSWVVGSVARDDEHADRSASASGPCQDYHTADP